MALIFSREEVCVPEEKSACQESAWEAEQEKRVTEEGRCRARSYSILMTSRSFKIYISWKI
jgi:hypothetical protein